MNIARGELHLGFLCFLDCQCLIMACFCTVALAGSHTITHEESSYCLLLLLLLQVSGCMVLLLPAFFILWLANAITHAVAE
jgi:hypothetical protein